MSSFEIIDLPKFEGLYEDLQLLQASEDLKWHDGCQICLNAPPRFSDNPHFGVGRLKEKYEFGDDTLDGQIAEAAKWLNEDPWVLCDIFRDTLFEDLYDALDSKYKVGRVRLMKSNPNTCYAWHQDPIPRLHYPIKTQEGCLMVIEDEVQFMAQDVWCLTDTTKSHTAVNGSKEERIHVVADLFPE